MGQIRNIVYHADIDGIMSAAVLVSLLGRKDYRLHMALSATRGQKFKNLIEKNVGKDEALIIVDFEDHDRSNIWVDHHYNKELGEHSILSDRAIYNPDYKSCFSLLIHNLDMLDQRYFPISKDHRDLIALEAAKYVNTVDTIDACLYPNIEFLFNNKSPLMVLRAYLELVFPNEHTFSRIVEVISSCNFDLEMALNILNIDPSYVDKLRLRALSIKDVMLVDGNTFTFVEQYRTNQYPRYSEILAAPEAMYNIRFTKQKGKDKIIGMAYNSWHSVKNTTNIGKFLNSHKLIINGGGHKNVGGGRILGAVAPIFTSSLSTHFKKEAEECMEAMKWKNTP